MTQIRPQFELRSIYNSVEEAQKAINDLQKTDPDQAFVIEMQIVTAEVINRYMPPNCNPDTFVQNFCNAIAAINTAFITSHIEGDRMAAAADFVWDQQMALRMLLEQVASPPRKEQH